MSRICFDEEDNRVTLADFTSLADGGSGNVELEKQWLTTAFETFKLFQRKQRDYGVNNIARIGERGVLDRTVDKVERMETMFKNGLERTGPANEPVIDTWYDIADYGIIGAMCHLKRWPEREAENAPA